MKFSWKSAKWLDDKNDSAILCRVVCNSKEEWDDKHNKNNTPRPEIQILDCNRRAVIHSYESTRQAQHKKINVLIDELQKLKDNVDKAWDKYEAYWRIRGNK